MRIVTKPFRIDLYLQIMNELAKNELKSSSTGNQYATCLGKLKRLGIGEDSTPEEVRDTIYSISDNPSTRRNYLKAIDSYSKNVLNNQEAILKGAIRVQCFEECKQRHAEKMPKHSLNAYRKVISKASDDGIRVALLVLLESGLRVGEVAQLRPENFTMNHGRVWIHTKDEKNKTDKTVKCFQNDKMYEELGGYLKTHDSFPSVDSIQTFLRKYGYNPHSYRKYYAQRLYAKERIDGKTKTQAKEIVRKQLGHGKKAEYTVPDYIGKEVYNMSIKDLKKIRILTTYHWEKSE